MEKVQFTLAEYNLPSRAVAQRLGMTLEGIVTNTEKHNGRIIDHGVNGLFKESQCAFKPS